MVTFCFGRMGSATRGYLYYVGCTAGRGRGLISASTHVSYGVLCSWRNSLAPGQVWVGWPKAGLHCAAVGCAVPVSCSQPVACMLGCLAPCAELMGCALQCIASLLRPGWFCWWLTVGGDLHAVLCAVLLYFWTQLNPGCACSNPALWKCNLMWPYGVCVCMQCVAGVCL